MVIFNTISRAFFHLQRNSSKYQISTSWNTLKKNNKKNTQNKQQICSFVFFKESRPEKSHLKEGPAFVLHQGYLLQDRVEFSLMNWLVCLSLRTATESIGRLQSDKTKTVFLFQSRRAISTHLIISTSSFLIFAVNDKDDILQSDIQNVLVVWIVSQHPSDLGFREHPTHIFLCSCRWETDGLGGWALSECCHYLKYQIILASSTFCGS